MRTKLAKLVLLFVVLGLVPLALRAFSTGPPTRRTGAAVDGGLNCTACHTTFAPANSDPQGKVTLVADPYTPGVKQIIRVHVEHPEASRWGFQLTARLASDETKQAGTFDLKDTFRLRCDPAGADGPCNGAVEFITHNRNAAAGDSTFPGTSAGHTWEVEWTPPSTDVGPVQFYAAGNAANNNGANSGDRIYTTKLKIGAACTLTGKPSLVAAGVVDAASFRSTISANSLVSIFGAGLAAPGTFRLPTVGDLEDGKFPGELSCVSVEMAGQKAPITFVSPNQINAQVPSIAATGPMKLAVVLNRQRANEIRTEIDGVQVQKYSPAFFTFNGRSIAALHTNFDIAADPAVVRVDGRTVRMPKPGDIVALFGSGFGAADPGAQAGELPSGLARLRDSFTVTIGGLSLTTDDILYAGLVPGAISGLYQFNVRIPATTADGNIPVVIQIGGLRTQDGATLAVKR